MGLFSKTKKPSPEAVERVKRFSAQVDEDKLEQRRYEIVRHLVAQDRRSVVLGKLQASPTTIARKARELADATIIELRTHKLNDYGRQTGDQTV